MPNIYHFYTYVKRTGETHLTDPLHKIAPDNHCLCGHKPLATNLHGHVKEDDPSIQKCKLCFDKALELQIAGHEVSIHW